jgi:chorismate mutase / prephenate dehydratase
MTGESPDLGAVRREIDKLDDRLHDLLMKRAATVDQVAAAKGGAGPFLRPGREAQILRRLAARHSGSLPAAAVVRIMRELISSLYRIQGPIKIAVFAPEKSASYWDLARNHFGSVTTMSLHRTAPAVLRAVSDSDDTLGLMTLPQDGEREPWWRYLAFATQATPRVVARLPFLDQPLGRLEPVECLVIGRVAPEPSGDDVTLVVLSAGPPAISRARMTESIAKAGLAGRIVAGSGSEGGEQLYLVEIDGFIVENDPRLLALAKSPTEASVRLLWIGAYARPLRLDAAT